MQKPLIDVLFMSEKRKTVLLLLKDGAKEMSPLIDHLKTSRQSLLPQMKILEEHHLITHYDDIYELTCIGKLIVDSMVPLLDKIDVLDANIDYWGSRELAFIPPQLLEKISQLDKCEIINPSIHELFSIHTSINPKCEEASCVYIVTNILYPDFQSTIVDILEKNTGIQYIVSQKLLDEIKTKYQKEFATFLKNKSFKMYVCNKEMKFLYFTFDSEQSLLTVLNKKEEFDHKFMLCKDQDAVDWIKELFEYYFEDSTLITEI